ncbi:MarR family winged helix-turn-helix transcriptional regulator [Paenibacillus sp. UNC451MF]|uniref:MarR family winged helix-turn-helix transcriptional regulator n=1 Tax=Paenibacillus sp. UNC451MF TaxID=1449063 RepID=UPI0004917664|nr:MarR family transcriptional regulator [Paenibacillus sp. UNC451MF]
MEQHMSSLLGFWMKRAYRDICNYLDSRLEPYGLTNSQLGVLMMLWEQDGLTQTDIQKMLGIQPASMTHLIKGLEHKQLVTRSGDPNDSRVKRLYVTEQGKALEQPCMAIVLEGEDKMRSGFSSDEAIIMRTWIQKVMSNLNS